MNLKKYCLIIWRMVDSIYFSCTRLKYIKKKCGERTMLRVRITKYKGRNIVLSDGTIISKNDALIKIHLHNVKLLSQFNELSEIKKALTIYRNIQESLPFVYRYLQTQKNAPNIKGLIGITMLHKGCRRLGFEPIPIQNRSFRSFKKAALFPIYILASSNVIHKKAPDPMYLFMSKKSLMEKYN